MDINRIGVTGPKGRLGSFLVSKGCIPLYCDITNPTEIQKEIDRTDPEVIINCAVKDGIAWCEQNYEEAMRVNMRGVWNLRNAFHGLLVQISTEYVFDGEHGPYSEESIPNPINAYGDSKMGGELLLGLDWKSPYCIVRTSNLFGFPGGDDFAQRILKEFENISIEPISVPMSLIRSPIHVAYFVNALLRIVSLKEVPRIVNISGWESISLYHWACKLATAFEFPIIYIDEKLSWADNYPRPLRGGLNVSFAKSLGIHLPGIDQSIRFLKEQLRGKYD